MGNSTQQNEVNGGTPLAEPTGSQGDRMTMETKCTNPKCDHVFKPVQCLYGNRAFTRCPKCLEWAALPFANTGA